jgi:uncharacterized protein Smg (DUF494 family)
MKPALVKLVDVILQKIQESPEVPPTETGLRSWLIDQGYKRRDIEAAIRLVRPRFISPIPLVEGPVHTTRSLSVYEEYKLTAEARSALMRLEMYGLIDGFERELILDRLGQFEGEVGLDELDYLLSWIVCGGRDIESQQVIFRMIDGEPNTLH